MAGTFWNFSLAAYTTSGVGDESLWLQDRYAIDVNLILFAAFIGTEGDRLCHREIAEIIALVREWHERTVKPLRETRRVMKRMLESGSIKARDSVAALRLNVKAAELEAEKIEQEWLDEWARARTQPTTSDRETAVRSNIRLLLNACDARSAPAPERLIAAALAQCAGLN